MNRQLTISISLLFVLTAPLTADEPNKSATELAATVAAFNDFSWKLFSRSDQSQNTAMSPVGVAALLAVVADGARGETRTEVMKALGLADEDSPLLGRMTKWRAEVSNPLTRGPGEWRFAQSLWIDRQWTVKSAFTSNWRSKLGTEIRSMSLARSPDSAAQAINDWTNRQTNGAIKSAIGSHDITPQTAMVLASAIYFEKKWKNKFDASGTRQDRFFITKDDSVQHPLMHQMKPFRVLQVDEFQAISLPYENSTAAMVVVLPRRRDGLAEVEASLDGPKFSRIWTALQEAKIAPPSANSGSGFFCIAADPDPSALDVAWEVETVLTLPKFHIAWGKDLSNDLKTLGISRAFDPAVSDLSGFLAKPPAAPLFLNSVVQRAMIEVDEQGTRAAAVTGGFGGGGGAPPERVVFRADHPFAFAIIQSTTGAVLFVGRVVDPSK